VVIAGTSLGASPAPLPEPLVIGAPQFFARLVETAHGVKWNPRIIGGTQAAAHTPADRLPSALAAKQCPGIIAAVTVTRDYAWCPIPPCSGLIGGGGPRDWKRALWLPALPAGMSWSLPCGCC